MGKNITITIGAWNGATFVPTANAYVGLMPSRTGIFVKNGSAFVPWEVNPTPPSNNANFPAGCVIVQTNSSGIATFQNVWFTDAAGAEVVIPLQPDGVTPTPPPLEWNIIDPNAPGGVKVYTGPLPSTLGGAAIDVSSLVALASPNTWRVSGALTLATYVPGGFAGSTVVQAGTTEAAVVFPSALPAPPTYIDLTATAELQGSQYTTFAASVKPGTVTTTGFTAVLSSTPAGPVTGYYEAR